MHIATCAFIWLITWFEILSTYGTIAYSFNLAMGNSRSMGWGSLQMRLRYDVCRRMTKNLWHFIEKMSLIEFTQLQSRDPEKIWTESAVSVSLSKWEMLNCWLHNLWRMLSLKSVIAIVHIQFSRKFKSCAFVLPSSKKFLRHEGSCLHNNVSRNFSKHCEIQFESPIQSFNISLNSGY